jgi:hypothetical protein
MRWTSPQIRPTCGSCVLQRWVSVAAVVGLTLALGCQSLGPSATVLRPHGPILTRTDALRQQHLERSHYQRDIPMFDRYLESGTDGHQQLPSRFHPVPTRNVFQPPLYSEPLWPGVAAPDSSTPAGDGGPKMGEELPPPRGGSPPTEDVDWPDLGAPNPSGDSTESWPDADAVRRPGGPTHREVVQYPRSKQTDRAVSDWVRGNYGVDVRQAPRLHSALQPYGGSESRYR